MQRKYFSYLLSLSLLIADFNHLVAQGIQPIAHLEPATIKIGEQAKLDLLIHQPRGIHVGFPKISDTIISKIQVVSVGKTDTTADAADNVNITVHKRYIITCFDAGTYTIPAFSFGTSAGVVKSNETSLLVQTVKVDTTKAIYDIKQPLAVSYTFWDWLHDHWLWVVIPLVVIMLIIGLIWYLKTRPKKEAVVNEVIPDLPIHIIALNKLQALREKKLWQQGEIKVYYIEMSDIIRDYLEKRYAIKTQEKTSDEIFASLKYIDMEQENRNLLRQILILSDLVKFAKEKPLPNNNEQSLDNAMSFVTNTRQIIMAPKPVEGGENDQPV